ncbi:MAG: hypothetical protein H6733_15540 [Alphaproteobacteria bacterium]|nr:hypothetical protein [Alphaproteobacteria bacterium]
MLFRATFPVMALVGVGVVGTGCKPLQEADDELAVAVVNALREGDGDSVEIARVLRNVERDLYGSLPIGDNDVSKRSAAPNRLAADDVVDLVPQPAGVDPAEALAVTVTRLSPYPVTEHARIPPIVDQAVEGLEPTSPNHYIRTVLEGADCWAEQGCEWLRTYQDLQKNYTIVPPIDYHFFKDFRWVDLNEGTGDDPRWGYLAIIWNDDVYSSENGKNTLWQAWGIEVWFPRDGGGFLWADSETPAPDGAYVDSASDDGGTLRMQTMWTQTELQIAVDEGTEVGTLRWGIDRNFAAHDAWLEEHATE